MATNTPNLGLTKPATTEAYSVGVQNANMDKIDAAVDGLNKSVVLKEAVVNPQIRVQKYGRVVTVHGDSDQVTELVGKTFSVLGTLPLEYRPQKLVHFACHNKGNVISGQSCRINTSGDVSLYFNENTKFWAFSVTYMV